MCALIPCTVDGVRTTALLDTGADVCLMSFDVYEKLPNKPLLTEKYKLSGISDSMDLYGWLIEDVPISFNSQPSMKWKMLVAAIKDPIIIGIDFLCNFGAVLNFNKYTFTLNRVEQDMTHLKTPDGDEFNTHKIILDQKIHIPSNTVLRIMVKSEMPLNTDMVVISSGFNKGALLPNLLVRTAESVPIQLVNDTDRNIVLRQGHVLGYAIPPDAILDDETIHIQKLGSHQQLPEHLQGLLERSMKGLSKDKANQVKDLLIQYQDIFSKGGHDLGCFTEIKHVIDTGEERPVKQPMRRTPLGFENEEEENLKLMLDTGVITESSSDWASAPVLVRKKDGTVRYCIDYRCLNSKTKKDLFPLPSISQCMDQLSGNQYFSTLDMASGYWQIEIDEKDRHKTAFITKFGLFEHKRMAFGLCNAPATFQRVIQFVLRGLTWDKVLAYIDDVIILGKDFEDHLKNLQLTFERFRKHNLKLKPKKCSLFHTQTLFLGRVVSSDGVSVNPENVQRVKSWPVPKSVKEVEQFLGFVNYHREHIQDFAKLTSVLYKLTGSRATFYWGEPEQEVFDQLKGKMISAPILGYPNSEDTFVLDTDASNYSIGAVLSQIQDGHERVICYGSYVLTPEQRKYCVTRKELLAVVRFTRQFRHYLLGRNFLLRTDHNSLTWLLRFKYIEGQLARWLEELSQFDMTVVHRPGIKHGNADGMSRIPDDYSFCDCYKAGSELSQLPCKGCKYCARAHNQWSRFNENVDDVVPLAIKTLVSNGPNESPNSWLSGYTHQELQEAQLADSSLKKLIHWVSNDIEPEQNELFLCSPDVKYFYRNKTHLSFQNGLLYYHWKDQLGGKLLLIIPECLKEKVMSLNHDIPLTGHMGIAKTIARIKSRYTWYKLTDDVEQFIKSCSACNQNKKATVKPKAPLGQYHAGAPLERVHIDILGPFTPSKKGNQYVLVIVDQFTKWLECFPLPRQGAEEVAKCVVDGFISRFGCPLEIHTDQGKNFDGKLFTSVCDLLQIVKTRTTPYRPRSNGQVERYNRTILQLIRCFLRGNQQTWDEHLQQLAGAIRSTINRNIGFTPNLMMLGREVMLPIDLMIGGLEQKYDSAAEYVVKLKTILKQVHTLARDTLESSQMRQKRDYDLKLKTQSYEAGDLVYKLDSAKKVGQSPKLQKVWKGPYLVVEVVSPVLFRIADRKKTYVLHHDRLKPCLDRDVPLWLRRKRSSLLQGLNEDNGEPDTESFGLDKLFEECSVDGNDYISPDELDKLEENPLEIQDPLESNACFPDPLPPTRAGRERKRPQYLADYQT